MEDAPHSARPVHIGCSGWNWRSWRGELYPPGLPANRGLARYAEEFETVEINSTFYRLARPAAAGRWVEQTPPGFVFSVKASRYLTHVKRLSPLEPGIERFYAGIEPLVQSGKLGPVLWQLPETFARDDARLRSALRQLPPGRHCIEFRHRSWFTDEVYELLRAHGVALAYGDTPERPWVELRVTAGFAFLRFHHGHRGRNTNYSESELREWAARIEELRAEAEVFAYFNNRHEPFALRNARRLRALLGA
jgi:uncharacterized protein YecE (DUF72 family)